ncbi:MAG: hypothetical protein Kow00114_09410 [Kiloniellaceae bacterium]
MELGTGAFPSRHRRPCGRRQTAQVSRAAKALSRAQATFPVAAGSLRTKFAPLQSPAVPYLPLEGRGRRPIYFIQSVLLRNRKHRTVVDPG